MARDADGAVAWSRVLKLTLGTLEVMAGLGSGALAVSLFFSDAEEASEYIRRGTLAVGVASGLLAVMLLVPGTMLLVRRRVTWWLQLPPAIALALLVKDLMD